ncbi:hypothetical protein KA012_01145 [Candidatus Woesebacteria bacterium]|nr:hypothetical protein [Candidatus Woesebacteria bacterium]
MKGVKYQVFYDRAKTQNQALFERFKEVHDLYFLDPVKWEKVFNTEGQPVLDILRATERQLCAGMERGGYGAYSSKLAEKFWLTVKKEFPQIDLVGVVRKFTKV